MMKTIAFNGLIEIPVDYQRYKLAILIQKKLGT